MQRLQPNSQSWEKGGYLNKTGGCTAWPCLTPCESGEQSVHRRAKVRKRLARQQLEKSKQTGRNRCSPPNDVTDGKCHHDVTFCNVKLQPTGIFRTCSIAVPPSAPCCACCTSTACCASVPCPATGQAVPMSRSRSRGALQTLQAPEELRSKVLTLVGRALDPWRTESPQNCQAGTSSNAKHGQHDQQGSCLNAF